ncbi:LOW QUALITY PROTEIN: hypothetical protein V2J09_008975 [Rumex salicifolius]
MAGRMTMAKAVFTSMPVYSMNSLLLPSRVCSKLNSINNSFIWGESEGRRKIHLLPWDDVCEPKKFRGLGLRKTEIANTTILGNKLGSSSPRELAYGVITAKYGVNFENGSITKSKNPKCLHNWAGIRWCMREVILRGIKWNVHNGMKCCFWFDRWLGEAPLSTVCLHPLDDNCRGRIVRSYWTACMRWDWPSLSIALPPTSMNKLISIQLAEDLGEEDVIVWADSSHEDYTASSAFHLLTKDHKQLRNDISAILELCWKVHVPERIKFFLWITARGKFMTDLELHMRHMARSNLFPAIVLNQSRLCTCSATASREIWSKITPENLSPSFWTDGEIEWAMKCLKGDYGMGQGIDDNILFTTTVWWLWKARNQGVFKKRNPIRIDVVFIVGHATQFQAGKNRQMNRGMSAEGREILIRWRKPPKGWHLLNTDGVVRREDNRATAASLIRDVNGYWVVGFVQNIGSCSVIWAELTPILQGLKLAWKNGFCRIILESDSTLAINLLGRHTPTHHPLSNLAYQCQSFISRNWQVQLRHVVREAYRATDRLAALAFDFPSYLGDPP